MLCFCTESRVSISKEFLLPLSDHVRIKAIFCTDGIELFVTLQDCNNDFRLEFWRIFFLWHDFVLHFLYVLNIPYTLIFSTSGPVPSIHYNYILLATSVTTIL